MDPSWQALRKTRDEVVQSRAVSKLQRELLARMQDLGGDGQLRTFNSLSTREKLAAVERAVKEVGETPAYAKLQSQVVSAIDRHFSPLIFAPFSQVPQELDSAVSSSSAHLVPPARPLAEACSRLLRASPQLKHSLKYAFNHPLPPELRLSAWKLLLDSPSLQGNFTVTVGDVQPRNESEREILQRCESIANDNPAFQSIADSRTALLALKAVVLHWKRRTSGKVFNSEILLCIPFIHVWREELKRDVGGEGKGEGWAIFNEIAGKYVHFMEMLPPSICSAAGERGDGMNKFSECVEELLQTEDPQLFKALEKLFKKKTGSGLSQRGARDFQQALKSVLFPHIQRMLVGDVSMDVVCYIWDQCFMGLDVPEYQCLPYFTTAWLILLRNRLLKATTIEAVEEALSVHSQSLTTTQFQQEMENRFLSHLSSLLKVRALPVNPTSSHPLLPARHPSQPSHRPPSHPSHLHPPHTPKRGRGRSAQQQPPNGDGNTEMDLQRRIEEIERKVERVLSHKMREEREQPQQDSGVFRKELKKGPGGEPKKRQSIGEGPSTRQLQSPVRISPSKQPTLLLVDASSGSKLTRAQDVKLIPVNLSSQQALSEEEEEEEEGHRPFSPSSLSEDDVKTLWLKVLKRFTTAAYTICHGTGNERQALFSTIQPTTSHTES